MPGGTALFVTTASTGTPVVGASVVIDGRTYTTDSGGKITLSETASLGAPVEIANEAALLRLTVLRSATDTAFSLWPKTAPQGITEALTHELIYDNGVHPLLRWNGGQAVLVPSPEIAADSEAMESIRAAATRIAEASRGRMRITVDPGATTGSIIRTIIDPDGAPTGASAEKRFRGHEIIGGTLRFKFITTPRFMGIVLHELGHIWGFAHTRDTLDIMGPGPGLRRDLSARELAYMDLMWQRRPGNAWPDDDRGVSASTTMARGVIHCNVE